MTNSHLSCIIAQAIGCVYTDSSLSEMAQAQRQVFIFFALFMKEDVGQVRGQDAADRSDRSD